MKLLVAKEVAGILRVSVSTVYGWAKRGEIPVYKVGGLVRFDEREILEWVKTGRFEPRREPLRSSRKVCAGSDDIEGIISRAIDSVQRWGYNCKTVESQTESGPERR